MLKNCSDEDLMRLYQEGHSEAFSELFRRYKGRMYSYLVKKTGKMAADDLFQRVFLKLHQNRDKFNPQYSFTPWFFVLASNVINDFWREHYQNKKVEELALISEESEEIDWEELLQSLSEESKKIIELRYRDEKNFAQMAIEMKTNEVNVRKKISRAIEKLKQYFEGKNSNG